jgi:hypothetical protein
MTLTVSLKEDPEAFLKKFDGNSDTPELIWDASMRQELRSVIGKELDAIKNEKASDIFWLAPEVRVIYGKLDSELYIGGVYVSRFLKEPTFGLRDPTTFLELLLQRWDKEIDLYLSPKESKNSDATAITEAEQDILHVVTTASVYLCKVRDTLCDKLAQWGYMSRSLSFLPEVHEKELIGTPLVSVMRLLHVASNRRVNVEALAVCGNSDGTEGLVEYTIQAIGSEPLHTDCGFMIEILKKVYSDALGDLKKARRDGPAQTKPTAWQTGRPEYSPSLAMAPSPAPGDNPVRKRVSAADDPLAFFGSPQPAPVPQQQPMQQAPAQQQRVQHTQSAVQPQRTQQQQWQQPGSQQQSYQSRQPPVSAQQQAQPYPPQQYQQTQRAPGYQHGLQPQSQPSQNQTQPLQYPPPQVQPQPQHNHVAQNQRFEPPHARNKGYAPASQQQPQPPLQQQHIQAAQYRAQPPQAQYSQQQTQFQPQQQSYGQQPQAQVYQQQQQQQSYQQRAQNMAQPQLQPQRQGYPQQAQYQRPQMSTPSPQQPQPQQYQHQAQYQGGVSSQVYQQQPQQQQPPAHHQQTPNQYANQGQTPIEYRQPETGGFEQSPMAQPQAPQPYQPHSTDIGFNFGPVVNTISEATPTLQYRPTPTEGSGIDARTAEDPKASAEQQAMSTGGAPECAQGRMALLQQALACRLCHFLVESVLENPTLKDTRDPASAKVHAIDLLKLLSRDPGYGPKFKLILDTLPAWKKYKSQDHSLFITTAEQKADYFLTDGGTGAPKKLLTQGGETS